MIVIALGRSLDSIGAGLRWMVRENSGVMLLVTFSTGTEEVDDDVTDADLDITGLAAVIGYAFFLG